jgi:D-arabinose 1-dehydrogenase-like Zn-dependent alcohol dehydrogenase
MISYQFLEHGKPLQKVLQETPKPTGTEVLVRITRSGVCHSDLHIWDGYFDWGNGKKFYVKDRGCVPPFTLGHEPFGVVEAFGKKAKGVKAGQKKLVFPWIGCGKCAVCKAGQDNYCVSGARIPGVTRQGGYATHLLVPDPKYLVDATGVDDAFAATLACSGLTAYSAATKLPDLAAGDRVAVIGCGGVGLAGIAVLKAMGIKHIVACDIDPAKLDAAAKLGAKTLVDTRQADAPQQLAGIAAAIDFVGMPQTAAPALAALRKGGRYILVGLHGGEISYPMPPIAQRAIGIVGSYVGNLAELKQVVALAKKKKLRPLPVATRPAEEVNTILQELQAGKVLGRVVLEF